MNTALRYLYRDASNYKSWHHVVLAGYPTESLVKRLQSSLLDGEWFIPYEVELLSAYLFEPDGKPSVDDHVRHEVHAVESTKEAPTDPRTFSQLVENFEQASWDELAEMKRVGMA